jgi:hypothetical protein
MGPCDWSSANGDVDPSAWAHAAAPSLLDAMNAALSDELFAELSFAAWQARLQQEGDLVAPHLEEGAA